MGKLVGFGIFAIDRTFTFAKSMDLYLMVGTGVEVVQFSSESGFCMKRSPTLSHMQ